MRLVVVKLVTVELVTSAAVAERVPIVPVTAVRPPPRLRFLNPASAVGLFNSPAP